MAPIVAWEDVYVDSLVCLVVWSGVLVRQECFFFWAVVCVAFLYCVGLGDCKALWGEVLAHSEG